MTAGINTRVPTRVGELAVADDGEGIPVVMWPSVFSDHRLYRLVVAELGDGWRTLAVDGPGFGASDPPQGVVQPETYAGALTDLLDELGLESAFFAGCSWGGQVTANLSARSPERTRGTLMMNTPLAPSLGGHTMQIQGTRLLGSTAFWGRGVARSMFGATTKAEHPERIAGFVEAFGSFNPAAAATTVRAVMTQYAGLSDVLPELGEPTTILLGAEDRLYSVDSLQQFVDLAPQTNVEVVQRCGHLAPLEAPEAVATALRTLAGAT